MDDSITLSTDDRSLLRQLTRTLGLKQNKLAALAEVNGTWLSQVFNGRRKNVDREMLRRVANVLAAGLQNLEADVRFPDERIRVALTSLGRFSAVAAAALPPRIYPPGGPVPVDGGHYIARQADEDAVESLQRMPFTMLIRGPVQCGKSSLLARLEHRARAMGIETAWFDPRVAISSQPETLRHEPDVHSAAAISLSQLLQANWALEPPQDAAIDSIPRMVNWLAQALALTASKPRLLILDDLSTLGAGAAEEWLALFVRAMQNKRATGGPQVSIAVGITHQFGAHFTQKLLNLSSVVNWWPRIELDWMSNAEVTKMESLITGSSTSNDLYELFAGQPFLTHAAAAESEFRAAVRNWTHEHSDDDARSIRVSQPYNRHLRAIRHAVIGRTSEPGLEAREVLQAFASACSGQAPTTRDQTLFLQISRLVKLEKSGGRQASQPSIEIYRLIANDLIESN